MSEDLKPEIDPRPAGKAAGFSRRKVGPARVALAFVLAVILTAATFGVLSLILWGLAVLFR